MHNFFSFFTFHFIALSLFFFLILRDNKTRPTHRRTDANLYPPERQLTKASEPLFDLEGKNQGEICQHLKIPST